MNYIKINTILLFLVIILATFLRFHNLFESLPFIGDTAWFYISARDLIIEGKIPLVGITTSHIWLHQGAFWTYILAIILKLFDFNPFIPAYFTSFLDILTLIIIYYLTKEMFDERIALIASLFYASSPLIVSIVQVPYHTSIIPFFTTLLLLSVYKWYIGRVLFFPITLFLLAVLYNLEISTIPLGISIFLLTIFGLIRSKNWALAVLKPKILFLSLVSFIIPMIPMLLYDLNNGFPQTLKVVAWMGYKIATQLGYPVINPIVSGETWITFFPFLINIGQRFYFIENLEISVLLFAIPFLYIFYEYLKSKKKKSNIILITFFIVLPLISYIFAKTNSIAYVPMLFPQAVIILGYFFGSFKKNLMPLSIVVVLIIVITNSHHLFTTNYFGRPTLGDRIESAKKMIILSNGKSYNIVGIGDGSNFESFTSNQEYITWWLGHGSSKLNQTLKFYIREDGTIEKLEIRK